MQFWPKRGPIWPSAPKWGFIGKWQTCHFCLLTIPGLNAKFEKSLEQILRYMSFAVLGLFWVIFWPFFAPNRCKFQNFLKTKKALNGSQFSYPYQKWWYLHVSFVRNYWSRTDGWWKDQVAHRYGCPNHADI